MNNLTKILIKEKAKIIDALKLINENAKGTAVVVNEENKLKGTLTDGDIRRALLKGITLDSSIETIYNPNCRFVNKNYNLDFVNHIFEVDRIKLIPMVDNDKIVIDIINVEDLLNPERLIKRNYIMIMAGGIGSRLKPLTDDIPKPMLKVGKKPILEILIDQFKQKMFSKILISVNYKADIIENYFKNGEDFDVSIEYIKETQRLGTAGSIKLAEDYLTEPFFVVNGDILTNVNFESILHYHVSNKFDITIGSRSYDMQVPYGVLNMNDICVTSLEEKPVVNFLVSGGIYVLDPNVIKFIPDDKYYDMTDLINIVLNNGGKVGSFPIQEYWMDIGHMEDYYQANEDLVNNF